MYYGTEKYSHVELVTHEKGTAADKPITSMLDYKGEEKTPETVEIKIENLKKVNSDYSDQKRQKNNGNDNSTGYNTNDLYGDNEYHPKNLDVEMSVIVEQGEPLVDNQPAEKLSRHGTSTEEAPQKTK